MLIYIIMAILFGGLCFKFGDLKNWKLYYPTILYYFIGDLTHDLLTYNYSLWLLHGSNLRDTFLDYFLLLLIFPSIIILFLSNYPKKFINQIIYIVVSTLIMSLIEAAANFTGLITYYHGWNIMWSVLFYLIMFPLLRLHFKKPLLVWPISIVFAVLTLFIFKVPLKSIQ